MTRAVKSLSSILRLIFTSSLLVSITNTVQADGYHYQIQTSAKFLANTTKDLTAIQLVWTYAPNEANQLLADKDLSAANKEATLKALGQAMLDDLFEFGYYSQLAIADQPALLDKVKEYQVSVGADKSLSLDFILPLKTAASLSHKRLSFKLVDPDGVATLSLNNPPQVSLAEALAKSCTAPSVREETLKLPNGHQPSVPTIQFNCQ